jgi:ferredoxin
VSDESTIRIDWKSCDGRGLCAELVPELIKLDEWGYPIVQPGAVPKPLMGHVKRAAAACPTLAVHVIKTPKP